MNSDQNSQNQFETGQKPYPGTVSVFELDKTDPPPWTEMVKVKQGDLICRRLVAEEAEFIQEAMAVAGDYSPQEAAQRFANNRRGYIGLLDGKIVTYGWVAFNAEPLGPSGYAFDPPSGDVYLYDFATLPAYRGRGYYPALLRFILADLKSEGVHRVWIGTAPGNKVSALSIARAGFQRIAEVQVEIVEGRPQFQNTPVAGVDQKLLDLVGKAHIKL
jgi:GNAT superfamily N-acetyltransferase